MIPDYISLIKRVIKLSLNDPFGCLSFIEDAELFYSEVKRLEQIVVQDDIVQLSLLDNAESNLRIINGVLPELQCVVDGFKYRTIETTPLHCCAMESDKHKIEKLYTETYRALSVVLQSIQFDIKQYLPDTTTEKEQTVKTHTSLLDDEEIKEVFNAFVEKGYMVVKGNYYHWNKSSHLLAYFCEKVSLYFLNSTKTYEGKDATEWKRFDGLFEIEIRGNLEHPNNERLRAYKNNWYRGKDRKTTPFLPDGYNGVEDILADLH